MLAGNKTDASDNNAGLKTTTVFFNWPLRQVSGGYHAYYGIANYADHDTTYPGHLQDWNCGTRMEKVFNHRRFL